MTSRADRFVERFRDLRQTGDNRWVTNPVGWRQRSFNEFDFLDDF